MIIQSVVEKIAKHEEKTKDDIIKESLEAYLLSKKNEFLKEKFETLSKYNVSSAQELKNLIKKGKISDHPAWEDCIEAQNIDSEINQINNDLRIVRKN